MEDTIIRPTKITIIPENNRGKPWFEDGTLILMTADMAFKVYKGMVARHSLVLREMCENGVVGEVVEGCPAIQLDDSTADLSNFLTVIHECER
jgi:hypothetical protein